MSSQVNVIVPAAIDAPRGALWFGQAFDALRALGTAVRASADARRRSRDAVAVRDYARLIEKTDPGMAADLRAAVDRHLG